jgi:hypothetical protein
VAAETPIRPSLIIRKKTQRAQNVFAGLGLVVIMALIIFGRRSAEESLPKDAPSASPSESTSAPPPRPGPSVIPVRPVQRARDSGAGVADAGSQRTGDASDILF